MAIRDDRRGLAIVAALAVTETTSWGVFFYGFGTFLPSMESSLGWSKLMLTVAFSSALLVMGLLGVPVGHHLDRHSPRLLMTGGSVLGVLGVLAWSYARVPVAMFAAWGVIGVAMSATLYEPAFVVLARRFSGADRRRALTSVTLLAGLSSTVFVPLEEHLIRTMGWRPALRVMALVLLVVTVPLHALVLRDGPVAPHLAPATQAAVAAEPVPTTEVPVEAALRDPRFWYLLTAGFCMSLTVSALIAHQLSFLEERGWSSQRAAEAIGAIGLWQVGGRLFFAPLAKRAGSRTLTVAVYASEVAALVVLAVSSAPVAIVLFVVGTGVARGMSTLVRATLVGELFGTRSYGAISARIALAATLAQAIGPILGSVLHSGPGGYTTMLWVLAVLGVTATLLASRIERPRAFTPSARVPLA